MAMPMRKILREFYPELLSAGHHTHRAAARPHASRLSPNRLPGIRTPLSTGAKKRLLVFLIFILVIAKAAVFIYYYNIILKMEMEVGEAKAQIDTQLQRRKDIVTKLNALVKRYARHEKEIFEHAVDVRKEMVRPDAVASPQKPSGSDRHTIPPVGDFSSALSKFLAVGEAFPGLRLNEGTQRLMDALVDAETKIAEQRMAYNKAVNTLSTEIHEFPGLIFARIYRFKGAEFYVPDADAVEPVELDPILSQGISTTQSAAAEPQAAGEGRHE